MPVYRVTPEDVGLVADKPFGAFCEVSARDPIHAGKLAREGAPELKGVRLAVQPVSLITTLRAPLTPGREDDRG